MKKRILRLINPALAAILLILSFSMTARAGTTETDPSGAASADKVIETVSGGIAVREKYLSDHSGDNNVSFDAYKAEYEVFMNGGVLTAKEKGLNDLLQAYSTGLRTIVLSGEFDDGSSISASLFSAGEQIYNTAVYGMNREYRLGLDEKTAALLEKSVNNITADSSTAHAAGEGTAVFRGAYWGMKKEDVIQLEGGEPDGTGTREGVPGSYVFFSQRRYVGNDCRIGYFFNENDELQSIGVVLTPGLFETRRYDDYIDTYNEITEQLSNKYGEPVYDNYDWDNEQRREYYRDRLGDAVLVGALRRNTKFLSEETDTAIYTSLHTEGLSFITSIVYESVTMNKDLRRDYSDEI